MVSVISNYNYYYKVDVKAVGVYWEIKLENFWFGKARAVLKTAENSTFSYRSRKNNLNLNYEDHRSGL